jgi:hypothetical protein
VKLYGQLSNSYKDVNVHPNKDINSVERNRQTARKWYRWLWLSPLLTIPTLLAIFFSVEPLLFDLTCPQGWQNCEYEMHYRLTGITAILGSALWHLVLLIPVLNNWSVFVRWHGRQEMILAAVRTTVPLLLFATRTDDGALFSILLLIPIWFFGTVWGQRQAARGDCSLMRWTGRQAGLPGPPEEPVLGVEPVLGEEVSTDRLVNIIRFSKDPVKRQRALDELTARGMVESL